MEPGTGKHVIKYGAHSVRVQTRKFSLNHFYNIGKHPAAYRSIKHHQQVISGDGDVRQEMPFGAGRLQGMKASGS